ncbi:two-component sensor histidine kinase [Leptolyngbya sp. BL0902]|uniref:ATP-binding protein n=1 Tax=Leptolyngbya sp. BL0902 TaxID=1115757 RepID=UPI0018E8A54C|nr:ATP-binding protein [Leptolyngbya sp. BL0902]QQE63518.1 two-component sensor histidine kinase [Leptolyngbya sp. BL0902]
MAVSLRTLLIVPFVLQVFSLTGLVGYLSYRSGQRALQDMALQLLGEMDQRVAASLDAYLQVPRTLARVNAQVITATPQAAVLPSLEDHFLQQIQGFSEITELSMTTPVGSVLEVSRQPNGDARLLRQPSTPAHRRVHDAGDTAIRPGSSPPAYHLDLEGAEGSWYRRVGNTTRGFWQLRVALHSDAPLLAMARIQPVYDQRGELRGTTSIGVLLPDLTQTLQQVMDQREGQIILIKTNGDLVATSAGEATLLLAGEAGISPASTPYRLRPWHDSSHALTRATVERLIHNHSRLSNIKAPTLATLWFETRPYLLYASPLDEELDWLIVTAMPSREFMATIHTNLTRTLLFCGLALIGSVSLGVWTAEAITKPILALQRATEAFAQEATFLPPGQPSQIKEVDALRQRFDEMVRQLVNSLQTLRHREDTLAIFLDGVPVAISVHGPDGQILFLNYQGQKLLTAGILPSQLAELSKDYGLYRAGTETLYPVEDLPITQGLRGKAAYADDLEIAGPERRIPVEVHSIPVFDDHGQVRYCIAAFQDITERRQAEALRVNYERELEQQVAEQTASIAQGNATKQALINAIPDLLMRLGRDGIPREIYNLDVAHWADDATMARRQPLHDSLPPVVAAERQHAIQVALATGTIQRQEYEIMVDGQTYWEEARIVPVTDDEVLVVVRDMSERHKIDRLKDEFIAMVSHELRTPLTAIRGALGILDSGVLQRRPDKAQHMLDVSLVNTDRLIRLVNDILDLERLASGKAKLVQERCDITHLVQPAIEGVEALALGAKVILHCDVIQATVWAAPDAIVQTLVNLLSNAIKFSPPHSHIWLRAQWHSPQTILFAVADQGRGIPADQHTAIFDRFHQIDVSDSRRRGGTGLGLAICKNIITQHGGDIWVESTVGSGSTFYFTLPIPPHG